MAFSKIKILFLINTLTGGGAEKVLVDLVNNLNAEKYDITVQTVVNRGVHLQSLGKHIHYKSINTIKNKWLSNLWLYMVNFILPPSIVYRLFIKGDYDYEVSFLEGVPTKLLSASTSRKSKKYAWVHTDLSACYGHEKVFPDIKRHIECYKKYNKIFCVSKSAKEGFIKLFGITENVSVLYNPVDNIKIKELAKEPVEDIIIPDVVKLISVGRLTYLKGYDRLLEVCAKLKNEDNLKFQLWLLGEGEDKSALEKYILNNDLSDYVKLEGFKINPYKYIDKSDIFICSSITEGFSTVVTEAVILEKVLVTTDCAGMKEILGNSEYGLIVENSVDGLYYGIRQILEDRNSYLYYKNKVRERSRDFQLQKRIKEIEQYFI